MALPYKPYFYIAARKVSLWSIESGHMTCASFYGGASELKAKRPLEKHARKTTDFTKRKSFHSDLDLGL